MNSSKFIFRFLLYGIGISIPVSLQAQLCSGSLGDPVVHIDFGTTGNSGNPLNGATTTYSFVSNDCPNDGFYTVRSQSVNCFGSSWHSIMQDHTGNSGGQFMLVNASFNPGDFYLQTVRGLCANTTYEFSAWLMNVVRSRNIIKPNITFSIEDPDGTVLQSYSTGDIPELAFPQWTQHGFFFTTPAARSSVVLRIRNNAPGGIGNDIALDDITFRPCGPQLTTGVVTGADTVHLCPEEDRAFEFSSALSGGFQSPAFQWQWSRDSGRTWQDIAGATGHTYQHLPAGTGSFRYRLTAAESGNMGSPACRISSNVLLIEIHPLPEVDAGPSRTIIKGNRTSLSATVSGERVTLSWSPNDYLTGNGNLQPEVQPLYDIWYTLQATSSYGCSNIDSTFVRVVQGIFIPNAFTPNRDQVNDTWGIPYLDPSMGAEVWVFNRWGKTVYHAKGSRVSWDGTIRGKEQPTGVYIYLIDLKDGSPPIKGFVNLLR